MTQTLRRLQSMYASIVDFYQSCYQSLQQFRVEEPARTPEQFADNALFLREIESRLEDLRKEVKREREFQESQACLRQTQQMLQGVAGAEETIRTDLCSAKVYIKKSVTPPKAFVYDNNNNSSEEQRKYLNPEYFLLMSHLQVPQQLIEFDVVRLNFLGLSTYVTRLAEQGWPLPPGVSVEKEFIEHGLKIRKKPGVNLLDADVNNSNNRKETQIVGFATNK